MKNQTIIDDTRASIKKGLTQLDDDANDMFKRMYSYNWGTNGRGATFVVEGSFLPDQDIDTVVDRIPPDRLEWALQQVENTLAKREKVNEE